MRVLVDECLPRFLRRVLTGHDVQTVRDCEWNGIKNGELLRLAEERFDAFLTSDKNLRYQQNLSERRLTIIELLTNRRVIVKMILPKTIEALEAAEPTDYLQIEWHVRQ
jgi:hypothetical protein